MINYKRPAGNSTFVIGEVSCTAESFVLRIKLSADRQFSVLEPFLNILPLFLNKKKL